MCIQRRRFERRRGCGAGVLVFLKKCDTIGANILTLIKIMEIKTRKQAVCDGDNKYFTGKPCKNGHLTFRYTQSGACYDCIRGDTVSTAAIARNARLTEAADAANLKRLIKEQLVQARFRLLDADRDAFAAIAWATAMMRYPMLTQSDVDTHYAPSGKAENSGMYAFNCHQDDVATLRQIAGDMFRAKTSAAFNPEQARTSIFGKFDAQVAIAPVPDWARVPRPGDFDYK